MKRLIGGLALVLLFGCGDNSVSSTSLLGIYDLQEVHVLVGASPLILKPPDATGRIVLQENGTYDFILIFAPGKTTFGTGFSGKGIYTATSSVLKLDSQEGPSFTTEMFDPKGKRMGLFTNLRGTDVRMTFVFAVGR